MVRKLIEWGEPSELQNAKGYPLFKEVELEWSRPTLWTIDQSVPDFDTNDPFLYILLRNHGNLSEKNKIEYVGLTVSPRTRFGNHPKARGIRDKRGETLFSYAPIIMKGKNNKGRTKQTLEEIEHLLIWALPFDLANEKKQFTLPGLGSKGGNAWHIFNSGFRFSGRMPREIIYPWMLVEHGRDRSAK